VLKGFGRFWKGLGFGAVWGVTPLETSLEGEGRRGGEQGGEVVVAAAAAAATAEEDFFFFFLCLKKRWSPGCEFCKELGICEKAGSSRVCQIPWPWICRMEQGMLGEEAGVVDLWQ
jgi:hypothetical protein